MEQEIINRDKKYFIRFLKDNKAYKAYIHNYYYTSNNEKKNPKVKLSEFIDNYIFDNKSSREILVYSFLWPSNFWANLNDKYKEQFKVKNGHYVLKENTWNNDKNT